MKRPPDSNRTAPGHGITPRPSRAKEARAGHEARTFLHHIRTLTKTPSGSRFSGGRLARGTVHPLSGRNAQRVLVKARIVRLNATAGTKAVSAHLHYLVRDGVGVDGEDPKLFTAVGELDEREVRDWIKAGAEDRHQFRFIVSPEHADQLDLTQYTTDLMQQMARDLKTNLDWIAVTHHDTDNPHAHIVLRGVDDQGGDLVISRDYMSRGLRAMAQDLATRELGPRTAFEIDQQQTKQLTQDRLTPLDQQLVKDAIRDPQQRIDLRKPAPRGFDLAQQYRQRKLIRLRHLAALGLAAEVSPGIWQVEADLTQKLRALGNRNDIIKTMHQKLRDRGETVGAVIFDKDLPPAQPITGQVVHKGLADELRESKYLLLAAEDGKTYYIALSKFSETPGLESSPGAIVTVSVSVTGRGREAGNRVSIKVESYLSLKDQISAPGPTWLDQHLARGTQELPSPNRILSPFEREKAEALQARFTRLQQMGLVDATSTRLKASFIDDLYRNELTATQHRLSSVYGKAMTLQPGQPFTGTLEQIARLSSGPHAVIRAGGEFTVIPWQRGLERIATGQTLRVERDKQNTVPDPTRPTLQQQRIRFATLEGVQKTLGLGISL